MQYKISVTIGVIGCVLSACLVASGSLAVAEESSGGSSPRSPAKEPGSALTVREQQCCHESDVLSAIYHGCFNQPGNDTYPILMNCSQHYVIYQDLEVEVHVNAKGSLVDGDYEIAWSEYCGTTLLENEELHPVFLVCFNNDGYASHLQFYFGKGIMMLVSVLFLAVTLYIYFIIPDLRETQDKVTSIAVASLMMFMLLLSIVQLRASITYSAFCTVIAFLMYFFMVSYFAWLNMVMANVWKLTVARRWKINEQAWYVLNHIYANTVALTLTAMVYIYHMKHSTFGEISCWFRTEREQSYFVYLPLSVMLSINIFLFIWTSFHLHNSDISADRKKALRYKCMLYLKLFLLAGLIWIFEIISFHVPEASLYRSWFWILIDSINCLHGVLIFFVLIVWRQRIKRELSGRLVFCIRCPASWAQLKDDEQEHLAEEEDQEYGKYDLIIK
ncbi:probable G-protein coupled receptor Mth-like 3 [Uranotaenia lowii]|uniref:probable G-protein coupled receptor Mth-like 3 n=1 Tax=Uranotaenia lowii TaxID=190385 RepID=UPI002479FD42|nr:probable G-protein coupled receptor Mth-like 3 [Uranotaenia lowii]